MSNFIPVSLSLFEKLPTTQVMLDTVLGEGFHKMTLGQVPTVAQSMGAVGADLGHLISAVSSLCGGTFSLMKSGLGLGVAAATNPYILGAGATLLIGSQLLSCSPKLKSIFDRSSAFKNTEDLTQKALQGKLPRAYGRERIIGQLNEALTDPGFAILLGGSGVGKSAVVEELACRIAEKSIPALDGARLLRLNLRSADGKLGLMGMFDDLFNGGLEKYIRNLIETLEKTNGTGQPCILFIDEIQDLLVRNPAIFDPFKEELARGSLKIIGATTDEGIVRQLTERKGTGAGMKRRVEVIKVSSMTDVEAVDVVKSHARALTTKYAQKGFNFTFSDDCYDAVIALSKESLGATLPNCATTFLTRMCV
ncbi:MAG TPA: AAA family ATPase, partial [Rhabdochlamydiaceae bacterium]|nr:AAA family ATPase [Rhabdochlamydiaceae bacterium]